MRLYQLDLLYAKGSEREKKLALRMACFFTTQCNLPLYDLVVEGKGFERLRHDLDRVNFQTIS